MDSCSQQTFTTFFLEKEKPQGGKALTDRRPNYFCVDLPALHLLRRCHAPSHTELCLGFQPLLVAQEDYSNDDFLSLYGLYFTVSRSPFLLVLNIGIYFFFFFTWTFIFQPSFNSFSSFQPNVRQDFQKRGKQCKHSTHSKFQKLGKSILKVFEWVLMSFRGK